MDPSGTPHWDAMVPSHTYMCGILDRRTTLIHYKLLRKMQRKKGGLVLQMLTGIFW